MGHGMTTIVEPRPPLPLRLRLIVHYVAIFLVLGVHLPFWPVWLEAQGLSAWQVGVVLSTYSWIKVISGPLVAGAADRSGRRRPWVIGLAAGAFVTIWLFPVTHGLVPLFLLSVVWGALFTPVIPLAENMATTVAHLRGLDYGRLRLWGSLSFIVGAWGLGALLEQGGPGLIWTTVMLALALLVLTSLVQPELTQPPGTATRGGLQRLLRQRVVWLWLGLTGLGHVSHAIYYGFSTLHWQAAGVPDGVIGALWAEGVLAEVLLFSVSNRVVARLGPTTLMLLGTVGAGARWLVLGLTTEVWLLALVQPLHALSFGALHLGAMHFIVRAAPPGRSATMQGLYSASGMGLAMGLAMLGAGVLYESLSGRAFLVMAGLAGLGTVLALRLARAWDGTPLADR